MAEKNEVQVTFSEQLTDKLISVENALPKNFNRERFVQNCLAFMNEHAELAKVNKAQVIGNLMKGAYLGLDFMNKECYQVAYGNSIQFQTSYIGECKFVKKYAIRPIQDIYAKVVREGDSFEEKIIDGKPSIEFHPVSFSNNKIVGAFAVVLYSDGGMEYEVMSTEDINNVRTSYSKASNSKAWKNSWDEMAKKTVLRRLCKHIETDFESVEARNAWEEGSDLDKNIISKPETGEINENPFAAEIIEDDGTITREIIEDEVEAVCEG